MTIAKRLQLEREQLEAYHAIQDIAIEIAEHERLETLLRSCGELLLAEAALLTEVLRLRTKLQKKPKPRLKSPTGLKSRRSNIRRMPEAKEHDDKLPKLRTA